MKKLLLTFLTILLIIYFGLSWADKDSNYAAEKMIWKANQKFYEVARDPEATPDTTFEMLERQYEQVIRRFPRSPIAHDAYLVLARVYLLKKDYAQVRSKVDEILKRYPKNKEVDAEALSISGKSYELAGDWPNALKVYESIIENYPLTEMGLMLPLYLGNYYQSKDDKANTVKAYDNAINHYESLKSVSHDSNVEIVVLRYLANCYLVRGKWTQAVETMGVTLSRSAALKELTLERADLLLRTINTISTVQLKNYGLPISIYEKFITEHPRHALTPALKKMIGALRKLKENNVTIKKEK